MSAVNHQFRLAARPVDLPKRSDWSLTEEPVPEPSDGEFLVKILYISLDPAMRGWMNEGRSYIAPVGIGEVMRAGAVGRVIASKHTGFAVGNHVYGRFGRRQHHSTFTGQRSRSSVNRVAGVGATTWKRLMAVEREADRSPDRARRRREIGRADRLRRERRGGRQGLP